MNSDQALPLMRKALAARGRSSSDFDLNPDVELPKGRKLRPAAVLVPIATYNAQAELILTKRASSLKHHPGQIAFPGGKQDKTDSDLAETALREAWEEIGLPQENVQILDALEPHETVTNFLVTPILALITKPFEIRPEAGEVEEVFSVPLSHVLSPQNFQIQYRHWQGRRRNYYTVPFGPYYIWGATARMLRGLADRATP